MKTFLSWDWWRAMPTIAFYRLTDCVHEFPFIDPAGVVLLLFA
jgi:hypothetical protein